MKYIGTPINNGSWMVTWNDSIAIPVIIAMFLLTEGKNKQQQKQVRTFVNNGNN